MKLETLATIYTPETVAALNNYREHLRETRMILEEKQKTATQVLEAYEAADSGQEGVVGMNRSAKPTSGAMVDIARRYGALVKEVESIEMEMKRLGG
jgi:diphthamide biosynthesis protein 3